MICSAVSVSWFVLLCPSHFVRSFQSSSYLYCLCRHVILLLWTCFSVRVESVLLRSNHLSVNCVFLFRSFLLSALVFSVTEPSEVTLVILYFHYLFMRKPTPACPLLTSELCSRWPLWRVVKLSSFLRTFQSRITSHFMLFSFGSSSTSCTCSSFSLFLHCALQSSVAPSLCGGSYWPRYS